MDSTDIRAYIETETGIPTAEVAFTKPQKLPFIAILDNTDGDGDDFHTRTITHDLTVEFYTDRINVEAEAKIEAALEKQGWKYTKDRTWISEEPMFETVYMTNFVEKR